MQAGGKGRDGGQGRGRLRKGRGKGRGRFSMGRDGGQGLTMGLAERGGAGEGTYHKGVVGELVPV